MSIFISREIFLSLSDNLQKKYIEDKLFDLYFDDFDEDDLSYIVNGILSIIRTNEKFHETYGKLQPNGRKQVDETCMIPAYTEPCGYFYSCGTLVICPDDWSWDENGDFDYAFSLARKFK